MAISLTGGATLSLDVQRTIDVILEPVFLDAELSRQFAMVTNLTQNKIKIGHMSSATKIIRAAQACNVNYRPMFQLSDRCIEQREQEVALKFCDDELAGTVFAAFRSVRRNNSENIAEEFLRLMTVQLQTAMKTDLERLGWFGDAASAVDGYNNMTGAWTYIKALAAANKIPAQNSNSGNNATPLTGQDVLQLLQDVFDNAHPTLKAVQNTQKIVHISGHLYDKLVGYFETQAVVNGMPQMVIEGRSVPTFRGVELMPHYSWDSILYNDFGLENENLVVLTTRGNFIMATNLTDINNPNASLGMEYERKTRTWYMDTRFFADFNYVLEKYISAAF